MKKLLFACVGALFFQMILLSGMEQVVRAQKKKVEEAEELLKEFSCKKNVIYEQVLKKEKKRLAISTCLAGHLEKCFEFKDSSVAKKTLEATLSVWEESGRLADVSLLIKQFEQEM